MFKEYGLVSFPIRCSRYHNTNQEYRANTILQAYNARIKRLLPYTPNVVFFIVFIFKKGNYYNQEILRKIQEEFNRSQLKDK